MHTHYVQGCSIDPFGLIVASLSSDRTLRFYQEVKRKKQKKGDSGGDGGDASAKGEGSKKMAKKVKYILDCDLHRLDMEVGDDDHWKAAAHAGAVNYNASCLPQV